MTASSPTDDAHHGTAHPPHLAHHFESSEQQFEAGKLGMWLFLATEFLLFGGLFCLYAVFRHNNPEMFGYGSQFLDTRMGALNTLVLILSSMTMALGVTAAQLDRRRTLIVMLALTFVGGAVFMTVKYFEYRHKFHENLVWGLRFYEDPHPGEHDEDATDAQASGPDATKGRAIWMTTCRACHGLAGEGIPGQGKDIRGSAFIAERNDADLVAFVKVGRMPFDPLNTTGIQMPPKGGNPLLRDNDLGDIIAYLRTFEAPPEGSGDEPGTVAAEEVFWIPMSSIPSAPPGPAGVDLEAMLAADGPAAHDDAHTVPSRDPDRPANPHLFFGIYFMMTGLHGLHVLVGMIVIAWLLVRAVKHHFSAEYFTPVDLGGLYWHVVDLIWIFLFPLFYLIA